MSEWLQGIIKPHIPSLVSPIGTGRSMFSDTPLKLGWGGSFGLLVSTTAGGGRGSSFIMYVI